METTKPETKAPKQAPAEPTKKPAHSAEHQERPIPAKQPADRAEILPATHIDSDPESLRLT